MTVDRRMLACWIFSCCALRLVNSGQHVALACGNSKPSPFSSSSLRVSLLDRKVAHLVLRGGRGGETEQEYRWKETESLNTEETWNKMTGSLLSRPHCVSCAEMEPAAARREHDRFYGMARAQGQR
eukprot:157463-Rhodomonas_salina.1